MLESETFWGVLRRFEAFWGICWDILRHFEAFWDRLRHFYSKMTKYLCLTRNEKWYCLRFLLGNSILDKMFLSHKKQNTFVSLMWNNIVSDFFKTILFQSKYFCLTRNWIILSHEYEITLSHIILRRFYSRQNICVSQEMEYFCLINVKYYCLKFFWGDFIPDKI